ncbi:11088_t:CDS:2, partial [Acaulospora colombiana]
MSLRAAAALHSRCAYGAVAAPPWFSLRLYNPNKTFRFRGLNADISCRNQSILYHFMTIIILMAMGERLREGKQAKREGKGYIKAFLPYFSAKIIYYHASTMSSTPIPGSVMKTHQESAWRSGADIGPQEKSSPIRRGD